MSRIAALAILFAASCRTTAPVEHARESEPEVSLPDDHAEIPGRAPTGHERRAIAQLLTIAENVRGLSFSRPVPFRVQSRDVITQFVRDQIDEEEVERSRIFYVALGLLAPALDVRELLIAVLGEQIVGYYDHENGLMVVREDVAEELRPSSMDRSLGEAEMVIVHELVHALQDQRLELGRHFEEDRSIDGENAFAALVEGDATLAMIGHLAERNGRPLSTITRNPGILRMLIGNSPQQSLAGDEMARAPAIVRLPLLSRYIDGLVFCATLHQGSGWPAVDAAHERAPESTEQVLHPERYLRGERPVNVQLPAFPELEAAGFTPHEEDTLGELEMGIYFGLGRGVDRDASGAEGWGGDRLRVYRNAAGETAVVWFTVWDDEGEAREAAMAARVVAESSAHRELSRVEQSGRAVLVVRDLPVALHAPVQRAFSELNTSL